MISALHLADRSNALSAAGFPDSANEANQQAAEQAARHGPFFVVLNAASGSRDAYKEQDIMSKVFEAAGREAHFLKVTQGSDLGRLAEKAVNLARACGGVVVAAGGDGTISSVAGAALGSGCPFGVLPQGTFNYFARAHGISQNTEAAAHALLGASVSPAQVGQVNGRVLLVNASVGLYPQLLEDREAWKQQLGRSRVVAFLSGLATLLRGGKQLRLQIESAGTLAWLRTPTLFVGNNQLQLARAGIDAAHTAALEQGRLAAIVVRPIGTPALLWLFLRGLAGSLGEAQNIDSFSFRRLTVTPRRLRRIKVATDGELVWIAPPLVFEVASTPLLLLVPAPAERAEVA